MTDRKTTISESRKDIMPAPQTTEYKSSWHEEYLDWICGFANAQGGKIYIGKDDTTTQ